MENLSHHILHAVNSNKWKTLRMGKQGSLSSYLMFVDGLLLFGEARKSQMNYVMDILHNFCDVSGQEVSKEKTSMIFSKNITRSM